MDHDAMGYTVALGLPALRQKIAGLYGNGMMLILILPVLS